MVFTFNIFGLNSAYDESLLKEFIFKLKIKDISKFTKTALLNDFQIENNYTTMEYNSLVNEEDESCKYYHNRICDMEFIKNKWISIDINRHYPIINNSNKEDIFIIDKTVLNNLLKNIKSIFQDKFSIENIFYSNVGYLIFKIILRAIKVGEIKENLIGINLKVLKDDIRNEAKKNLLIKDNFNFLELKINDYLVYYVSTDL